jgi:SAM-dependent methyltransferase
MNDHRVAARIAWGPLMSEAALCARDMGVLAALGAHGPLTPAEVKERTRVTTYAAHVLLEACSAMELARHELGRYSLTAAGRLFLSDTRTRVDADFVHDVCYRGAFHLREALEEERPAGLETFGSWATVYEGLTRLPEKAQKSWLAFDHFYSDAVFGSALEALGQAGVETVLDVGGNTGRFAVLAAKTMKVTLLDHAPQLELARENARRHEVSISTVPMNLLDHAKPFPTGFDAVWMCQLADCFPECDIVKLFSRARAALSDGGRLWVVEPLWERQPSDVARYCVQATSLYFACIANGTSRMYHSAQVLACGQAAGLELERDRRLGPFHTLLVFRPAGSAAARDPR